MKTTTLFIVLLFIYSTAYGDINLQDIEIPDIDDVAVIKERCDAKGGKGTYEKVKTAKTDFQNCVQGLVDVTVLKNEVEEAKKTGSMDEVFGKYCNKRPKVRSCVATLTDAIKPCLEETEKQALNVTLNVLKELGEFVCFRDGDRIAMFVAEGGVECIKDHTEGIKDCVNKTLKIDSSVNTNSLPNLLIDSKKCEDLTKLQTCVVEELEKCKDSTPANIVDALFRFIKRSACPNNKNKRSVHSIMRRSASLFSEVYNQTEAKNKLFKLVKDKCSANAPNGGYEGFLRSAENTTACIRTKTSRNRIFVTSVNDFKQNIQDCTEKLVQAATNCLPSTEKYYPQFYMDIIYSLIDFAYANKDQLFSTSVNAEVVNCFQSFKREEAKGSIVKCFAGKEDSLDVDQTLDKQTTCERISKFKNCVSEEINRRCISDVTITKLKDDFFAAFIAPCNKKNV